MITTSRAGVVAQTPRTAIQPTSEADASVREFSFPLSFQRPVGVKITIYGVGSLKARDLELLKAKIDGLFEGFEEEPEPRKAIWKNKDHDQPVTVLGDLGGWPELLGPIREAVVLGKELPRLIDLQQSTLETIAGLSAASTAQQPPIIVPINILASERYMLGKGIPAVVQPMGDGFTATYFDANIATSGDTQEEAVSNLKSLLVELFEDLDSEQPENLGPEPTRQLAVLREIIQPR